MLRTAFIGAGGRARSAHYPTVTTLADVHVEAVCELDAALMAQVVEQYAIPRTFDDYGRMLDEIDLDLVYVIMGEELMAPIAIDCMNAGTHVFIEKPAGANPEESRALLAAAEANRVTCAVGYQRRFAAVSVEAKRLVAQRGGPTLAVGEFHKCLLGRSKPPRTTMWQDVCHAVDLVRYLAGSEVADVAAFQDARGTEWTNDYTSVLRFENGATGVVLAHRSSGGRVLKGELHGIGVGCSFRIPDHLEVLEQGREPRTEHGADLAGVAADDSRAYDGTLEMHRHVAASIREGRTPINDIRDVVYTSDLVARLEGDSAFE